MFPAGWYVYVGSALGPGGLAARLCHHLAPMRRPHWHIDHLRTVVGPVVEIWYAVGPERRECDWATRLATRPGATRPIGGFGASDCRCPAHLFHFVERPRPGLITNKDAGGGLQA
jgi:Uri superfamily endonuclease